MSMADARLLISLNLISGSFRAMCTDKFPSANANIGWNVNVRWLSMLDGMHPSEHSQLLTSCCRDRV